VNDGRAKFHGWVKDNATRIKGQEKIRAERCQFLLAEGLRWEDVNASPFSMPSGRSRKAAWKYPGWGRRGCFRCRGCQGRRMVRRWSRGGMGTMGVAWSKTDTQPTIRAALRSYPTISKV